MLLTYTYLYNIITISLKTIGWRQLVKPSRYRNTMYTCIPIKVGHGVRSSTANTYVSIRNIRRPRCRVLNPYPDQYITLIHTPTSTYP